MTGGSPLDEWRERRVYPATGGLSRILECGSLLPLCAGQGKPCPEEGGGKPPHSKATTAAADSSPPETRLRMTGGVQGRTARGLLGWRRATRSSGGGKPPQSKNRKHRKNVTGAWGAGHVALDARKGVKLC